MDTTLQPSVLQPLRDCTQSSRFDGVLDQDITLKVQFCWTHRAIDTYLRYSLPNKALNAFDLLRAQYG